MRRVFLLASLLLAGCAGTSPNLSTPQMQTPTLGNTGLAARPGLAGGALTAEASLPSPEPVKEPEGAFIASPYLQLGNNPSPGKTDTLALLWHAAPGEDKWSVETRPAKGGVWKKMPAPVAQRIAIPEVEAHDVWSAALSGLAPGQLFDYRVLKGDKPVFLARARARRSAREAQRVVVFGDHAAGTAESKKIAFQVAQTRPDLIVTTGDSVYDRGRIREYREKFYPIYNVEAPAPDSGAPLTRSTLWVAAPGNHDILASDLDKYPDTKAFFYYWSQPLNGPLLSPDSKSASPISGAAANQAAFAAAAGKNWPRMATCSFDAGSVHWVLLDANSYVNWADPALQAWLERDLKSSRAAWKLVALHHPPFHSSEEHQEDQWMRVLAPIFERSGVSIVFSGHVHNYQRSLPLKFAPTSARDAKGRVEGTFTFDKDFDGATKTKPAGVLYIVSGAGGAGLYKKTAEDTPEKWQPFTRKYIASVHSFTVLDIEPRKLSLKQLSIEGKEIDGFSLTK